ncbi:hypothetical protein GmarT_58750 [Gimesia maris]|uniref:Uncharacterized protein n=2 Tax=Gimesia maris TaxID=122 RepID=A0ABX5YWP5_9PLAN|nr:hypothetical protein Mal35_56780 [Gimesia maris]QDU17929.1 hypothetical protein CA11_57800 [Gimesia maris]QEG19966.1 hypothetical protein GmarT_58750 [Gimesia maris]
MYSRFRHTICNHKLRKDIKSSVSQIMVILLVSGLTLTCINTNAQAQFPNDGNSKLVNDLLRLLEKSELATRDREYKPSGLDLPPTPQLNASRININEVRQTLNEFSKDSSALAISLNRIMYQVPGVREYIADVLKIRARASILSDRMNRSSDLNQIASEYGEIDQLWRVVSLQLENVRGLDRETQSLIARMNQSERKLGDLLQTGPQLKRTELLTQTSALSNALGILVEDIEIEFSREPQRFELVRAGQEVEQRMVQVSNLIIDRQSYDSIKREYLAFRDSWNSFATRLRPYHNRIISRGIQRVVQQDRSIQELLWLPQDGANMQEIAHLTEALKRDVDEFYRRATLRLLISLPPANYIATSDEFYGTVENLIDTVNHNESTNNLITSFSYIEQSWKDFSAMFHTVESPAALQLLDKVNNSINALRVSLRIEQPSESIDLAKLVVSLETQSTQLSVIAEQWLATESPSFRQSTQNSIRDFSNTAHELHRIILMQPAATALVRSKSSELFESWFQVHEKISRCETREKYQLQETAVRITQMLMDLRYATK